MLKEGNVSQDCPLIFLLVLFFLKVGVFMLDLAEALSNKYDEIYYMDFYRDLFPVGSFEQKGIYEQGKYNGIAVAISPGEHNTKRYTITDDLDNIEKMALSDDFCLMSPISYVGKQRNSTNARLMYAMAIDLDGVEDIEQWHSFITQIEEGHKMLSFVWGLPKPTYVISSGTGLHLYYVFEDPFPLFPNIVKELEKIKKRLTWQAWTQGSSSLHEKVQYESLFQGFRVVGTITKTGSRCRAFKVGNKVTIDYLNHFVPEEYRVKDTSYFKSNITLDKAKKLYPEWYQKRIIEKKPKNTWVCKRDLYDWWIRKLIAGANQGHRYWCIMTLATYAKKCDISREELENDAYGLIPFLNTRGDKFTEDDVMHALEAYSDSYITYPIDTIVSRTGIPIKKNKRNGRSQSLHLKLARSNRDILCEERGKSDWREGNGRPKGSGTAANKVYEWRQQHLNGKKIECERETKLSRPTVLKWWNYKPERGLVKDKDNHIVVTIPKYLNMTHDEIKADIHSEFEKEMRKQSNE